MHPIRELTTHYPTTQPALTIPTPYNPPHHQLPQYPPPPVPQWILKPTFSNINNVKFPDILRLVNEKQKFYSEDDMTVTLLSALSKYGVTQFSTTNSVRNDDTITHSLFPRLCVSLICRTFSHTERKMPASQPGCCGIFVEASMNEELSI